MSLFFADMVRETSWGTGTGDLPLEGALPGHRRFADAAPAGARFHYCIAGVTHPDEWETGEGEIGSGGMLARLPLASSAAGAAVDFSPGLKTIALTVAADWFTGQEEDVAPISDIAGLEEALAAKQPLDATLTAMAGVTGSADTLAYFTAADALTVTDFPVFGRTLVANVSAAGARSDLAISAVNTPSIPAGNIAASNVQAALEELDGEKQPLDSELTAIAGLISAADSLPYFTGPGTAALATFTAFGRSLADDADAAAGRTTLGLGTVATQAASNIAITGGTISGLSSLSVPGTITATGRADIASTIRATGQGSPTGGAGVEIFYASSGVGYVASYNRDTSAYRPLNLHGSTVNLGPGSAVGAFTSTGLVVSGSIDVSGHYRVDGTQVVSNRTRGWSIATGTATRTTFDTAAVTTAQLAERVKALIDDLTAHGLIGS